MGFAMRTVVVYTLFVIVEAMTNVVGQGQLTSY